MRWDYTQVASIYRAARHAPTSAVAAHFGVSKTVAAKAVSRARERGLIPATSRGRTSLQDRLRVPARRVAPFELEQVIADAFRRAAQTYQCQAEVSSLVHRDVSYAVLGFLGAKAVSA